MEVYSFSSYNNLSARTGAAQQTGGISTNTAVSKSAASADASRNFDTVQISEAAYSAERTTSSVPKALAMEIERLTEQVKGDEKYMNLSYRMYIESPAAQKLMTMMILADESAQDAIVSQAAVKPVNTQPDDLSGRNQVKAALLHGTEREKGAILKLYYNTLVTKARTTGLTEQERLFSSSLENIERTARGTFDEQMAPVYAKVKQEFQSAGQTFDDTKTYSFSLNTETFLFSVSGGTEEENALLEQVINRSAYPSNLVDNNRERVLAALIAHRTDDMKYTPWRVDSITAQKDEMLARYGVADIPAGYANKMKQLFPAYDYWKIDQSLQRRFGFGIDDVMYDKRSGKLAGRTDEQTAAIERGGIGFMKETGFACISVLENYTGTPEFSEPLFTFEGGKFHMLY